MIYLYNDKVYLMRGTENIKAVKSFTEAIEVNKAQDYLKYIFFTYHKQRSPFITLPLLQRKEFVVTHFKLFGYEKLGAAETIKEIENDGRFQNLLEIFLDNTYSELERQSMVYAQKLEHYQLLLSNPLNTPDQDIEYDKVISVFRKQKMEIDGLIAMENDDEESKGNQHLFEIPDEHNDLQENGLFK